MKRKTKFPILIRPEKSPIFYGYIIAIAGTIGVFASLPGQTVGVSTFTDPVKLALGLSRDQISFAYFLGTFTSSLLLPMAGRWYDRFGARKVGFFAAVGLGITLLICSVSDSISGAVQSLFGTVTFIVPFVLMSILFLFMRFSGQGVLTLVSRNVIMEWFSRYRGRVNSFSALFVTMGFSLSPFWISLLIQKSGWQNAWLYLGCGLMGVAVFIYTFFRNKPEEHGLMPDGKALEGDERNKQEEDVRQYTLKEAQGTRAFWMYSLTIAFYSFFYTGLTFHVESVYTTAGYTNKEALAIFFPIFLVSIGVSFLGNMLSDKIRLIILLYINIIAGIVAVVGFLFLEYQFGYYLVIGGIGVMSGLFTVLSTVTWPRFYGRKHLGAISGKFMAMLVLASALAPFFFSTSKTWFGYYGAVSYVSIVFLIVVAFASIKAKNPQ